MNCLKAGTVISSTGLCYLYLYLTGSIPAVEAFDTPENPIFEPGGEYHIKTDNKAIGTQGFNVFVPLVTWQSQ